MSGRYLDDIDDAFELARDEMRHFDQQLDEVLPQYGPGFRAPKTEELPVWALTMRQQFPPSEWEMPGVGLVVESPYLLALGAKHPETGEPLIEDGPKLLRWLLEATEGDL